MKTITTKLTLFIATIALCISINACKKSTTDSDISTAQDEAQAENESNYIGSAADAGAVNTGQGAPRSIGGSILPSCATATFTAGGDTNTITITFNGCVCPDHKTRTGTLIVTWSAGFHYRDSGIVIHTYTKNYYVDNNLHNYTKWVKNLGHTLYGDSMVPYFSVIDTAKIITTTGTILWTSSRTRTWIAGSSVPLKFWDTQYSITGSAKGTDRNGLTFTVSITSPIIANFSCPWVLDQGTYDLAIQGKAERIISFVDGCSGNATCTIDGVVYNFMFGNY